MNSVSSLALSSRGTPTLNMSVRMVSRILQAAHLFRIRIVLLVSVLQLREVSSSDSWYSELDSPSRARENSMDISKVGFGTELFAISMDIFEERVGP